ncbi:ornithine carbamoyltransferase [Leptospira terpstrae]|uniref:Ornithine carbamoyltransferase n=1 Tax=Leptospira terpstrae serovar Hualin str. LT 11-33 = ATCC 700639 TaxID=1257025 RepID=N1VNU6_9LEPT|nr:ornithine carbamoyltransferase [Leptospira terpstrae]EMY60128.1 putative ornithine carbamoyltransferase [Leptospira terpstrae serovar Hualin str. LT 11-33 = ATCC 700639]
MSQVKHLISWQDWSDGEIRELLEFAVYVKKNRVYFSGHMAGRSLAMLFQKTSTRTRVSFEAGMTELGGHAIFLDWMASNFLLSDIDFEGKYLSSNVAILMARLKKHEDLLVLKSGSTVPVINGCCNLFHPCQSLADILTIVMDSPNDWQKKKLCYIGVHNNVANSLIEITAALGIHLTLVTPIASEDSIVKQSIERAKKKGTVSWETDVKKAVSDSDYVYTDTWVDMEYFNDPKFQKEKEERIELMMPYQVNAELLKNTKAKVMHDMPIHAGYEITREMVESDRSIIFTQAENRLDAQKAVILKLLENHH